MFIFVVVGRGRRPGIGRGLQPLDFLEQRAIVLALRFAPGQQGGVGGLFLAGAAYQRPQGWAWAWGSGP